MPAIELIAGVRKSQINRSTLIIALVDGREQVRDIFGQGANFIVYKPVSAERAGSSLRAARGLMAREKRGKFRVSLHAPASITYANAENVAATLLDLSEDGLAIQAERRLPPRCKVYFQFNLPGEKSSVRLSGDVVWQDSSGRVGIRFVDVPQTSRRTMNEWIKSSLARLAEAEQNAPRKEPPPPPENGGHPARGPRTLSRIFESPHPDPSRLPSKRRCLPPGRRYSQSLHAKRCQHRRLLRETQSPFPSHTVLDIVVRTQDMKLRVRGTVQVVHPGFGMGVQFSLNTADERQQVKQLIAAQAAQDSLA